MVLTIYLGTIVVSIITTGLTMVSASKKLIEEGYTKPKKDNDTLLGTIKKYLTLAAVYACPLLNLGCGIYMFTHEDKFYDFLKQRYEKEEPKCEKKADSYVAIVDVKEIDEKSPTEDREERTIDFNSLPPEVQEKVLREVLAYIRENESQSIPVDLPKEPKGELLEKRIGTH